MSQNSKKTSSVSVEQICKGFEILGIVEQELKEENPSKDKLTKLSESFLMAIPQKINTKDKSADVIDSLEKLAKKVELCEELGIAKDKISIKKVSVNGKNPFDVAFDKYKVKIQAVSDPEVEATIKRFGQLDILGYYHIFNLRAKLKIEKVFELTKKIKAPKKAIWVWSSAYQWGID